MKRLAVGSTTTPKYNEWWVRRINDNIPKSSQGDSQSIEEHLRLEEEKMHLGLDVDVQKLETEKLR
ncbi:hypothetical protein Gotur_026937 [Gossypium turneri]